MLSRSIAACKATLVAFVFTIAFAPSAPAEQTIIIHDTFFNRVALSEGLVALREMLEDAGLTVDEYDSYGPANGSTCSDVPALVTTSNCARHSSRTKGLERSTVRAPSFPLRSSDKCSNPRFV